MTTLTIDREYLTNTLADLVRINSDQSDAHPRWRG